MTTLNEQELQDVTQGATEPKDAEFNEVTAKRFIGSLTGNASTATQLQNNFSVVFNGDVEGRLSDCNGAGGYVVNVKVNESNHAKSAEFTAKTNYSDHAHFADLANLATHSLTTDLAHDSEHSKESDKALHSLESDHALQSDKSLQADSANNAKESEHAVNSDNSLHAVQADTDSKERNIADTFDSILYTDLPAIRTDITNITPTEHTVEFKDKEYKLKNTLLADENNENKLLQDFSNSIEDVDNRITNLETTSDLGKVTERIVKIEELNEQQNTHLNSIDEINNAHETRLDNVETLANNTANTVTANKNTVDEQINNLQQQDDALSNRITNLNATHTQDIKRLDDSDANLQEQITSLSDRATGHDTSLGKLFTDLSTTNNNIQTNADNIATNTQGIADNLSSINTIKEQITDLQTKTVDTSISNKGIVQLTNDINSSEDKATTPKAVQTYVKNYVTDVTSVVARSCFEDIGTAGKKGFGQSACSDEVRVKELGFRALQGTVDPDSDNYYGVYEHEYAGLCCYIPKFWVRIGSENAPQYSIYKNNSIEIASGDTFNSEDEAKTQGYFLPRAFIDSGEIKRGFFLQKYNSRASSSNRADGKNYPTSYITNNNLVSITANDMIDRAKLLGDNWNVATCFMLAAHQLLTLSLAQMANWYTWCKWYKPTQNYQYPTIGLSATNEGLYTHNGMPNGISGLSYVWQFCTGITTAGTSATQGQTAVTSNDIYLLKKEKSFTELTSGFGGDTDAWGTSSSLLSMYDKYTSPLTLTTNRHVKWGNGEYDVLTNGYNKDSGNIVELDRSLCGVIPKDDNAISSNGSNQMASSLIYQNPVTKNLALYFGGETLSGNGNQPCFSRLLDHWRTLSYSHLGFRCACYA